MNGSDQYYRSVLEALTAFVREGTTPPAPTLPPRLYESPPPTDIQAALTVIGRRTVGQGVVNLTKADIAGAFLNGADLTNAALTNADLAHADLTNANLTLAHLTEADLTRADLTGANLTGAGTVQRPIRRGLSHRASEDVERILVQRSEPRWPAHST